MKIVIAAITLAVGSIALANPYHHGMRHFDHHQHRQSNWGWVAPAVIGGAVVYGLTRPAPVIIQQPNTVIIDGSENVPNLVCSDGRQLFEERGWYKDQLGRTIYGTIYGCK